LSAVEPRLANIEMKGVPLAGGGHVLLIKIPQSWRPPHRVTLAKTNRFFLRHSNGVFEPDTEGLRKVFNSDIDREQELERFRAIRLERLQTGARGFAIKGPGKLLVQVVSLARGHPDYVIPPVQECVLDFLPPIIGSSTHRFNFDGLLLYQSPSDGMTNAYTQIFRDWKIEMACGRIVGQIEGVAILRPSLVVGSILFAVERSIKGILKHGGIGPFAVMVTIVDLAGTVLGATDGGFINNETIDRSTLTFPTLIVDGILTGKEIQRELLPIWDGIWQAYDHRNCSAVRNNDDEWAGVPPRWIQSAR
jgi:hypothetical protein